MHSMASLGRCHSPLPAPGKLRGFTSRAQRQPQRHAFSLRRLAARPAASEASTGQQQVAAEAPSTNEAAAAMYNWELQPQQPDFSGDKRVREIRVADIRRPLAGVRANDQEKVAALMRSIEEVGLHEPIDVLEVEGIIYGFSGCHRFEAHQRLGKETILCRVRKATPQVLRMHLM